MDERIKEHLKLLNKYYLLLVDVQKVDRKKYLEDFIIRGSTERFLQLAIESCLNIGNRLLSLYQFEKPVKSPETYADIFVEMRNLGAIDFEFSKRLEQMAKFRNRLVHIYWDLDPEKVYQFVRENLDDFKLFEQKVVKFLNKHKIQDNDTTSKD